MSDTGLLARATAARLSPTPQRCFFGAFDTGNLVGIVRLSRYEASNQRHRAYVAGFYVRPAFRMRGHGETLLRTALDRAVADPIVLGVNLHVVIEQHSAIRLYQKFGFTVCGIEREAFSCDGKFYDEQLMTLSVERKVGVV